jgi:hypothetical protein
MALAFADFGASTDIDPIFKRKTGKTAMSIHCLVLSQQTHLMLSAILNPPLNPA